MRLRERVVAALLQLGHRVIELPALTSHRTPKFFPEVELGIAVRYEFPKSEILTHLLETGNFPGLYRR